MASDSRRAKMIAEIAELQRLQRGSNHSAALGGWTEQSEAWYEMRSARISGLRRELEALDQRRGLMNAEER